MTVSIKQVVPLAAVDLLRRYREIAEKIGVAREDNWIASVDSFRLAGNLSHNQTAVLLTLEQRCGGYWIDAPSGDLGTHTLADTRFIYRDMCVRCCSLRADHLEDGQCLFAPGSTFEETKP